MIIDSQGRRYYEQYQVRMEKSMFRVTMPKTPWQAGDTVTFNKVTLTPNGTILFYLDDLLVWEIHVRSL